MPIGWFTGQYLFAATQWKLLMPASRRSSASSAIPWWSASGHRHLRGDAGQHRYPPESEDEWQKFSARRDDDGKQQGNNRGIAEHTAITTQYVRAGQHVNAVQINLRVKYQCR